jgi:hypothetical protein
MYQCSEYYLNYKCEPDANGGHCVPDSFFLKSTGESCSSDSECASGRCDFLPIHNASVCVPTNICTPGEFIPKDPNVPFSCSLKCSSSGTSWITQWDDCTNPSESNQYCDGNILKTQTVVYENGVPVVREQSVLCPAGCIHGACIANVGGACIPGDYSYVQGSCQGMIGCPAFFPDQSYDGNCLATCNDSGQWEVAQGCGYMTIDSNFTDTERFEILLVASRFGPGILEGAGFNFIYQDNYYLDTNFLSDLLGQIVNNYEPEQEEVFCAGTYGTWPFVEGRIEVAQCGLSEETYAHELAHYIVDQDGILRGSYSVAVGCEGSSLSSEGYQFNNEGPINDYAATNCEEAMAEAAAAYQVNPCNLQANFPIQYEWMRDNLYGGVDFCNQSSYVPLTPASRQVAGTSTKVFDFSLLSDAPSVLATTTPKTHIGQFTLGSAQSQLLSELGPASESTQEYGLNILSYNTDDSARPDIFIFDSSSKLIYFRVGKGRILENFRTVEPWTSNFNNPEALISSSLEYLSTRFIYPRLGFSFVTLNDTGEVIQYEAFNPIYLDEYLDTWGQGINQDEVGYPTTHQKGDINRDLLVNSDDYSLFLPEFGKKGFSLSDIDWDRAVDGVDYVIWLNNTPRESPFGPSPTQTPTSTVAPVASPTPTLTPIPTFTPTPTPAPISSLLVNPGFENGSTAWTGVSSPASVVSTESHTGLYSLQINQPASGQKQVYQVVNVTSGQSYAMSGWIKTNATNRAAVIYVYWRDSSGAPISSVTVGSQAGTANWTYYSTSAVAPAGAATARFYVSQIYGAGGTAWFDDLSMQQQ